MKTLTVLLVAGIALAMGSCATRDAAQVGAVDAAEAVAGVDFSAVMNRGWILSEIRTDLQTVTLDRDNHIEQGFGDIFTLHFGEDSVHGVAMPNTFNGPYSLGADRSLTFGHMMTSLMLALVEPEEITEYEFFSFLSHVSGWDLVDGNLELRTATEGGTETILVFVGN